MSTRHNPKHPTMTYPAQHRLAGLALEAVGVLPSGRPVWPIMGGAPEPGEGGDGGGDNGGAGGDQGGQGGTGGAGGQGGDTGSGDDGRTFRQADIDRIVSQRLADQKRAHDREVQQAREDAGKSDTQRIEAERDRAVTRADTAVAKAGPKVAQALAQVAAITAGGRGDRAAAIVRQADLEGVVEFDGDDWTVDTEKVTAAIDKVLGEYPEWKVDTGTGGDQGGQGGTGGEGGQGGEQQRGTERHGQQSGGDLKGGSGDGTTLEAFQRMSMGERATLAAQDPEAYRRLSDSEIAERGKHRAR